MHWWQVTFRHSSSSSSTSKHRSEDRTLNKILRGRAFRNLGSKEIGNQPQLWRSPSSDDRSTTRSQSLAVPQPLPLPELSDLARHRSSSPRRSVSNSSGAKAHLPSPRRDVRSKGGEERDRGDGLVADAYGDGVGTSPGNASTFAHHDYQKSKVYVVTQQYRKAPQEQNGMRGRLQQKYNTNLTISAPTSPISSPQSSPQQNTKEYYMSSCTPPHVFQVWSAPELPPSDMNLGGRSPFDIYLDKTAFSVDNSPIQSPRLSPQRSIRSPSGPPSPLHKKLSVETPSAWRDNNSQANVHPLPLPPGASSPSQPAPIPHITAKTELMPRTSQWKKGKLIGRGTFGSVYVASNSETGALCAMKEVELFFDDPKSMESMKQLEQEIKVLSNLKHPNIVQYYGSEIIGDRFYIYLEYVHPGSLNKYIREHCGKMTESVVRNFTRHILSGLAYLHSTKTIHRDIKGANLLVDANGVVKLADFGMAKHLSGPAANLSLKGSPYWMAPELLQSVMQKDSRSDLALAIDIWSLGCTIIEMLNGKPPWSEYEGAAAMFKVLRETPSIPEMLSPEGKDFLRCCFRRNPADRPSASKLLEHRFLKTPQLQHLDVPNFTHALNGMTLMDNAQASRDTSYYKLDQLVASSPDRTLGSGKMSKNENTQRYHHEASDMTVATPRHSRHSPRSTLEAFPSLSPPQLDCTLLHPSPSVRASQSFKPGAAENNFPY
ncbi:Mitogen-activated protein kinase kinase kinase [Bertholletia excelsa]